MTPQHHAQSSYDADRCPDCGGTAQGRGFFGRLYCGLCERSLPKVSLAPVTVLGAGRVAA